MMEFANGMQLKLNTLSYMRLDSFTERPLQARALFMYSGQLTLPAIVHLYVP